MKGLCQRHLESQRMSVLALGHIEVTDMGAMGACQWETRATTTEGNEGEREKQWHKDGVSLKWSHTRKKQTFIPNVSCAIPKKKKKKSKRQKNESWGEKCLHHQTVTVFLLFYFSDNNDNTFILRHIQYFIHCLWETHAMFLCGRLLGMEKRKQLPTTAKGKVQLFIQYVPMWLSPPLFWTSHHGNCLLSDKF